MKTPYFFGYGSLVNRATHDFQNAHTARISGRRRAWRHFEGCKVAFLTAVPDANSEIAGLTAAVPGADWDYLDQREHSYDRVPAYDVKHNISPAPDIHIYHAPPERHVAASTSRPVLLSYIDVVVQGYLREFGEDAVADFFATTDGWDAPILDDRAEPIYPRHQVLKPIETELVEHHLGALRVKRVDPSSNIGAEFLP
ncbi:MAG: gamma-glutamylcyclotransferase [Boseongicola sp.]